MKEIGVTHIKVVGRGKLLDYLTKDIMVIRELVACSYKYHRSIDFENFVKTSLFSDMCPKDCYYSERLSK